MSNVKNGVLSLSEIKKILDNFRIMGELISYEKINKGYINQTYNIKTLSEHNHIHQYILQRVNDYVFRDIEGLMRNVEIVTEHLRDSYILPGSRDGLSSTLSLKSTKAGKSFYRDEIGYWRIYKYFDNVKSFDIPDSPDVFRHAGEAFGLFIIKMSDVDPSSLAITIPNFHNTPARFEQLMEAVENDRVGRVKEVMLEIEIAKKFSHLYGVIAKPLEDGKIPMRICHNDCNLNNILFDYDTKLPVAIIDLDTVMPSSPLYDFGDSMRIGTNTSADDETDLSKVSCNLELYREYAEGFLSACGGILTKNELDLLPYASMVITVEDALRFLADYINGDIYYTSIAYPKQNLDRARNQFKLASDMHDKLPEIKKILSDIYKKYGYTSDLSI